MNIYRFNKGTWVVNSIPIESVEVASVTDKSVFLTRKTGGSVRREARDSEYSCYRDKWQEVKSAALRHYDELEQCARKDLERAVQNSAKIREFIAIAEKLDGGDA